MSTLAEFIILSSGDNRPPMLEKHLTKKYEELSATEKIQANCDLKATNIILQGIPSDVYSLVNHHRVAKDLWERVQLLMQDACPQPQSIPQVEYIVSTVNQQTYLAEFPQIDSGLAVLVFKQGDDSIDAINKMMSFLSIVVTSRFPTTNNQLRNSSNPRQQATIHDGRCLKPKRKRDAAWFRDKVLLVEAQRSSKVLNEEELEFLADLGVAEGPDPRKDIVDNAAQVSNATTIAPGMYKLDPVTLAPKDKNNRETHIYYLKHTMEQAAILREIVEQAKSLNPLDSASYSACKYVKLIQELLGYVRDTCPDIHKPSEKLVVVTPINKKKTVSSMFDTRHELCFLEFVSDMNASSKSKTVKKAKKKEEWKHTGKVITATNKVPLWEPIPLEVVAQESVVTKVYTRRPNVPKTNGSNSKPKIAKSVIQIVLWYLDSGCSKHMTGDRSQLNNFVHKFLDTVKFGNDQIAKIIGYGDYQIGNITILRVYYVEGLGHNLFFVGQFCDSDLEVAFRKHTCFIRNLEGVDLLLGSRETNLYTLSFKDMMASSPTCLLSKASKTKSWLWHRRLSHLNFGAINHLAKNGLVRGLPRLKFEKEHLCLACAMGKSKKQSHKPKSEDTNQEKLYLLHMDLCGPIRVASINGKKYILIIVDDYSQFTWMKFLASKDEAFDFIIKFLKMIQVRLNTPVRNIRTDNGAEFVNQTLRSYYESVGIFHETLVARSPQQNGVVESKDLGKLQAKADIGIFIGYAGKKKSYRPGLQFMTPATSSSGLVAIPIPQQPCNPPPRDDWDLAAVPRAVDLADSPVSTLIDQDAPSTKSPKTLHFHDDPLHESLQEDSTSQGSSSNVRPIYPLFESLDRWT
ncbi:retrovirus-related pol polyprotein from transposon TNT 1-94 [Tanacetum coccineum]|uniref:Retrovirus-related pol polyprotein from transposon TNT 1-94 n=1 Tax=Tanacetum coccineum TaxID=301880 RepID=A0ABQ5BE17_9ASTR